MEKGRVPGPEFRLASLTDGPSSALAVQPLPPLQQAPPPETPPFGFGAAAPSPQFLTVDSANLRGAGAILLTRYGRSYSADSAALALASPSTKKKGGGSGGSSSGKGSFHVPVPGPGSYDVAEAAASNSMSITSNLKCNPTSRADRAQPSFRSNVGRFDTHVKRFAGADPLRLENQAASRQPHVNTSVPPSPHAFKRGNRP